MAHHSPRDAAFSAVYVPVPAGIYAQSPNPDGRAKRRQVKNACTNCQTACKKCDDARPCNRCLRSGHEYECVSSTRKPRVKGGKRGPYRAHKKCMESSPDEHSPVGSATDDRVEQTQVAAVEQAFGSAPAHLLAQNYEPQPCAYEQSSGHRDMPRTIELSPAYQPMHAWASSATELPLMYSTHPAPLTSSLPSPIELFQAGATYPATMMELYYMPPEHLQPYRASQGYWM